MYSSRLLSAIWKNQLPFADTLANKIADQRLYFEMAVEREICTDRFTAMGLAPAPSLFNDNEEHETLQK